MNRTGVLGIALATVIAFGCNDKSQTATSNTGGPAADTASVGTAGATDANKVSDSDKDFVRDAAIVNQAEIELANMATEKSMNAGVKKFGQTMIEDHSQANQKLGTLASQYAIPMATALDDKHRELRDKLAGMQGRDFDREYIDAMVDGHSDFLDKLESRIDKTNLASWKTQVADRLHGKTASKAGEPVVITPEHSDNPVTMSINRWAADTYPVGHSHYESAKALQSALKGQGRRTTQ